MDKNNYSVAQLISFHNIHIICCHFHYHLHLHTSSLPRWKVSNLNQETAQCVHSKGSQKTTLQQIAEVDRFHTLTLP
jgi:hypothetical protein